MTQFCTFASARSIKGFSGEQSNQEEKYNRSAKNNNN